MAKKSTKVAFDPNVFLATVNGGRTRSSYRKGSVIFSQGETADSIFYILKGRVKIAVTSEQGKEAVVAILGAGVFFGEGCLIAQPVRLATATAMTECTVTRVQKAEMIRVLHDEQSFAELFTKHLLTTAAALRRIWSTSCSTQARSAWHGRFSYWRISARRARRSRS